MACVVAAFRLLLVVLVSSPAQSPRSRPASLGRRPVLRHLERDRDAALAPASCSVAAAPLVLLTIGWSRGCGRRRALSFLAAYARPPASEVCRSRRRRAAVALRRSRCGDGRLEPRDPACCTATCSTTRGTAGTCRGTRGDRRPGPCPRLRHPSGRARAWWRRAARARRSSMHFCSASSSCCCKRHAAGRPLLGITGVALRRARYGLRARVAWLRLRSLVFAAGADKPEIRPARAAAPDDDANHAAVRRSKNMRRDNLLCWFHTEDVTKSTD
jgi:hypothetical protein